MKVNLNSRDVGSLISLLELRIKQIDEYLLRKNLTVNVTGALKRTLSIHKELYNKLVSHLEEDDARRNNAK